MKIQIRINKIYNQFYEFSKKLFPIFIVTMIPILCTKDYIAQIIFAYIFCYDLLVVIYSYLYVLENEEENNEEQKEVTLDLNLYNGSPINKITANINLLKKYPLLFFIIGLFVCSVLGIIFSAYKLYSTYRGEIDVFYLLSYLGILIISLLVTSKIRRAINTRL